MTTKITVDAHAGWPVRVEVINPKYAHHEAEIVQPGERRDFFVFDTRQLLITEMSKDTPPAG